MSKWDNLILWVNEDNYKELSKQLLDDAEKEKPIGIYKDLISYIKKIVDSLSSNLIDRYFYLSELDKTEKMKPSLFLALEVKDKKNVNLIKSKIKEMDTERPDFIISTEYKEDAGSADHPEEVLDFFYGGTKYTFFRISEKYERKYEKNDETKMVHCFCNQLFIPEVVFYAKRLGIPVKRQGDTIE